MGQRIVKIVCRRRYTENVCFLMKTAFVFPGQGSQYVGMGKSLAEKFAAARAIFDQADQALGFSLTQLCFEGPAETLQLTENMQPALLTVSVAAWQVLDEQNVRPDFVAGHSLGEYSALVAAKSLAFADAVRLVRKRGQYMQEAVPVGVGAMAALLKLPAGKLGCRSWLRLTRRGGDGGQLQFAGPGGDCRSHWRRRTERWSWPKRLEPGERSCCR